MSVQANPYAPPSSRIASSPYAEAQLAERGSRLVAAFIDSLFYFVPLLPGFLLSSGAERDSGAAAFGGLVLSGGALIALAIAIYQWVLLSRVGQTLGKRWMGVRVVRVDGQPIGFASAVALRAWLPGVIGVIPFLGPLFNLVNILFIFGQERRCLHDLMAGTKVIDASAPIA